MATNFNPTELMEEEGASLTEKFCDFVDKNGVSRESLIGFMGMMNPIYITRYGREGELPDEIKNELVEFYDYFCMMLPEMVEEMDDAWENVGGPIIFRLARAYKNWTLPDIDIVSAKLPDGTTIFAEAGNEDALISYLDKMGKN